MNKVFSDEAWNDYVYWQTQDKKTLKWINILLRDIERNGNVGVGNPELLKGNGGFEDEDRVAEDEGTGVAG